MNRAVYCYTTVILVLFTSMIVCTARYRTGTTNMTNIFDSLNLMYAVCRNEPTVRYRRMYLFRKNDRF